MSKKLSSDLTAFWKPNRQMKTMSEPDPKPADLEQTKPPTEPAHEPRVYPEPPTYHWDFWAKDALERGLDRELVILGRAVIRETDQHAWHGLAARLAEEHVVERLMTRSPKLAERLYEVLLETDGLQYAWVEDEKNSSDMIELPGLYCR